MIRFAALLATGTPTPEAFAHYAEQVGPSEAATARALLSGQRPKRIAAPQDLLDWVAEATQTAPFLLEACLNVSPDKAEVAALLLPPAAGTPPSLTEALPLLTDRDAYLTLAATLPPEARLILTRLATGTFRTKLAARPEGTKSPGTCLAILTLITPSGPEGTFALRHGNALVPLTKLRLTLPETAEILTWSRANTTDRFGPVRQVRPELVFEIGFDGMAHNPRRKCGVDLVNPVVIGWLRQARVDEVTETERIARLMPPLS